MKTKMVPSRNSISCAPWLALLLIPLVLACFALSPQARAVCQEGCLTDFNTVLGEDALLNNTGTFNTAIGFNALYSNTTGFGNIAIGAFALYTNTTGSGNTAIGNTALSSNTTGFTNTATGGYALGSNTTGNNNTATGQQALFLNRTGFSNTATGVSALQNNTNGSNNTATGIEALYGNTSGNNNIAVGNQAGINLTTGNNNIDIGDAGVAGESKTIRIGTRGTQRATFIAGIHGVTIARGVEVIVDAAGQLGTVTSSARFKTEIKPMDKTSEAILALQPVTFRYKRQLDPAGIPQFGLVAEQVAKVDPDLVARDEQGNPYTVRYDAVNAMLLNEFLKEHRKVQEQEAAIAELKSGASKQQGTIADLKSTVAQQQKRMEVFIAQLKEQAAQLNRVSAALEARKPARQVVVNNQ